MYTQKALMANNDAKSDEKTENDFGIHDLLGSCFSGELSIEKNNASQE